ncbi:MAG: hypothetical protein ACREFB_02970 [Stellaceae bacterium]
MPFYQNRRSFWGTNRRRKNGKSGIGVANVMRSVAKHCNNVPIELALHRHFAGDRDPGWGDIGNRQQKRPFGSAAVQPGGDELRSLTLSKA